MSDYWSRILDLPAILRELGDYLGPITLVAAFASFLLFYEARAARLRREAIVEVAPELYGQAQLLVLAVINSGPAVARDLSVDVAVYSVADATDRTEHSLRRRAMLVSQVLLLPRVGGKARELRALAEDGYVLEWKWAWKDDRRVLWIGPRRKHRVGPVKLPAMEVWDGHKGSGMLVSPTTDLDRAVEKLQQSLRDVSSAIERFGR